MCLHFRFVLYWRKPTGAKAAHRTLMKLSPGGQYDLLIIDGGRKVILAIEAKISANQVEKAMRQLSAQSKYFMDRHGFVLTPGK